MSAGTERLECRTAEVGDGLIIRRALPNRRRRTVGAWCFFDHAGPVAVSAGGLHVGPHPHIGLQTFTWMIEGAVTHRDSLGNEQLITPGQVNIMTAGAGIAHSEDSVDDPPAAPRLHAAQLWIALPDAERHRAPDFRNHPLLPRLELGGFGVHVLAGSVAGRVSPVTVYSPLMAADLSAGAAAAAELPLAEAFEHAALVLEGAAEVAGEALLPGTLLYLAPGRAHLPVTCPAAARLLVIGGVPFAEEVLLWWNFVARNAAEMAAATDDWNASRRFGAVHGSPSAPLRAPPLSGLNLRA